MLVKWITHVTSASQYFGVAVICDVFKPHTLHDRVFMIQDISGNFSEMRRVNSGFI